MGAGCAQEPGLLPGTASGWGKGGRARIRELPLLQPELAGSRGALALPEDAETHIPQGGGDYLIVQKDPPIRKDSPTGSFK